MGVIALIIICMSYFCKDKSKFLIFQIFADFFYAMSYLLIDIYVAGIITIISTIRCIIFWICDKRNFKYTLWFLPIFILCYIGVTIKFWSGPDDIVPLITCILFTIAYILKSTQAIRYVTLIPNMMLIVYNLFVSTYSNALLDLLETIVIIISIIKFHKLAKAENKN